MPRKQTARIVRFGVKQAKLCWGGLQDTNLSAKVIAARKFHSGQGGIINQKLTGSQEYKRSQCQAPLVRQCAASFSTFAAAPLTHAAPRTLPKQLKAVFKGLPAADAAPSFASLPLWKRQHLERVTAQQEARGKEVDYRTRERLAANPLWRYAQMGKQGVRHNSVDSGARRVHRREERGAMKWFANLDPQPVKKVSSHGASKGRPHRSATADQMRQALAAYSRLA